MEFPGGTGEMETEISRGKVRKLKFPGFFSKKVFSQHPSVWNYKKNIVKFPLLMRPLGVLFILDTFILCGMYAML